MRAASPATRFLLALSMLKGVGPASLKKVAATPDFFGEEPAVLGLRVPQIARSLETEDAWRLALEKADRQIDAAKTAQSFIISAVDPEYPRRLATTKDDPFILYVKGKLARDSDHSVAVIGTREPTAHGIQIAQRISRFFVEKGSSIVSGLALGCDAIAHETALECGGHTVAVLAHGLQMISPSRHKDLAERILESGGALVSEYPFGQSAQAQQFVKRDKTQAGLADGVVMIQSDLKGGSLHASRAALEYGRWLAVPYPTDRDRANDESKIQANLLIAEGTSSSTTALLRCSESALAQIVVLRSKEDYQRLLEREPAATVLSTSKQKREEVSVVEGSANGSTSSAQHTGPDDSGSKAHFMMDVPDASAAQERMANNVMLLVRWEHRRTLSVSDALATIERFKSSAPNADTESLAKLAYRLKFLEKSLQEISKLRSPDGQSEERSMFLQFSVENAWRQMKSVVDSAAHSYLEAWIRSQNARAQAPNDLLEFVPPHTTHSKPPQSLEEVLSLLRADLATAVVERSPTIGRQDTSVREVDFDDLIVWFNASLSVPNARHEDSP
ncbi:DNA-protecting protein DprA [Achromobacter sp. MY14]|uniref:DNA-processing protein DprA n=1 Tax=unclassified Achromobacter TaxID=2626865 RepID=UPI001E2DD217|nr:DNA-processing protein DprA [Achromobacter sp. MY14]MCD0495539.1 DNA-protecting protein DprA [Achromobacter sp. MY14]